MATVTGQTSVEGIPSVFTKKYKYIIGTWEGNELLLESDVSEENIDNELSYYDTYTK